MLTVELEFWTSNEDAAGDNITKFVYSKNNTFFPEIMYSRNWFILTISLQQKMIIENRQLKKPDEN